MAATILDGRAIAATIKEEVKAEVAAFSQTHGTVPGIAVIQVGEDPAADRYVRQIARSFEEAGMAFSLRQPDAACSQAEIVDLLHRLNDDPDVSGIIVQMPLPKHLPQELVAGVISPAKDVDGISPINAGRLLAGTGDYFAPATPSGGMEIIRRAGIDLVGKRAVIVGRSNIVGKPMALLLLHQHATITICHSRTADLAAVTGNADILVAAIGKARFITADMIKPGATVIDFGVNVVNGKAVGDVDFTAAAEVAGAITPVPGGTGPTTNVMLLRNTLEAAKRLHLRK
jgi:methylenetetrahydrofolate dehydrogenase (NADP+) / methenyltetrahydrofolate cyclohydrolase